MGDTFKSTAPSVSKTAYTNQDYMYGQAHQTANDMAQASQGLVGQLGQAYGGQLTPNTNEYQQQTMNQLNQWMGQGGSGAYMNDPMYQQAKAGMGDLVSGKYLGQESPWEKYVAQMTQSKYLPEAQGNLRQAMALRGGNYSSAAAQGEGDILTDFLNQQQGLRAQNYGTERQNQMNAYGPAMQIAQNESQAPLQTAGIMNQYGQQQYGMDQSALAAQYNEWNRARGEQFQPLQWALQNANTPQQYNYQMNEGKASPFSKYIAPALQVGAVAAAPFTGGASLAALGPLSAMGNQFSGGNDVGGFANMTNALAPYASMASGAGSMGNMFSGMFGGGGGGMGSTFQGNQAYNNGQLMNTQYQPSAMPTGYNSWTPSNSNNYHLINGKLQYGVPAVG